MKIAYSKEVTEWKSNHPGHIKARFPVPRNGTVELIAANGDMLVASIPYDNGFCLHESKCAGLHSCPRNYACSE